MKVQTEIKQSFEGGIDVDSSFYEVKKNSYVDALNITRDAVAPSADNVPTNISSNRLVPFSKPAGTNITIGKREDLVRNRIYEMLWNSNNFHTIIIYDNATRTRTKLLQNLTDTGGIDILQWSRYKKIVHIDIIYRDDEGDLLFWTDANTSPRKVNVKHLQTGAYSVVTKAYTEIAKAPILKPLTCAYGSDATRNSNSLRKQLFMFAGFFGYDDFEKPVFSTYSKIPLPIGYYGSDNNIDNTKNNFITITIQTGDQSVKVLYIAMRNNNANLWNDFVLVASLNKAELNIPDNSSYDFLFYNDQIYPPFDVEVDVLPLQDYVPQVANALCLPNGNVVAMGGITEGYDPYPVNNLNVTITAANQTNIPPDTNPPSITYIQVAQEFTFTVNGGSPVPTGTNYKIYIFFNGTPPSQTFGVRLVASYTSIGGDTTHNVAVALYNAMVAFSATPPLVMGPSPVGTSWNVNFGSTGSYVFSIQVVPGSSGGGTISTEKTWLWDANYILGQSYEDEKGRLMPGVTNFVNPVASDNDYLVTTPSFSLDVSHNVQTPVITAQINHLPYAGAKTFNWDRRRTTYDNVLFYMTCDFQSDTNFLYFCLANIEKYKAANSQFIYGTAPIDLTQSRIKVIAEISASAYTGNTWTASNDYEILGTVVKTLTGGSSPADDRNFIKVAKPAASISPAYSANMLVMVYTPLANPIDEASSVYYEWGEEYDIFTGYTITYSGKVGTFTNGEKITGATSGATAIFLGDNMTTLIGISDLVGTFTGGETITGATSGATLVFGSISASAQYHRGMTQDQTSFQPAIYVWIEGDVYFHERTMYNGGTTSSTTTDTVPLMDVNWSDFFASAVNDNGRAVAVDVNAKRSYFPSTVRYSLEFQQFTNINQTNRFLFNNFQDYDRSFGDIFKLYVFNRYMDVGQRFKIGTVPIFNQMSRDSTGNMLLVATDKLLNPIFYYEGDYGVSGESPVWVVYNNSRYFFDTNRGIWCRLSQNGIEPISVLYKTNSWMTNHGVLRTGNFKIYGTYDPKSNNCIFAFEQTDSDDPYTWAFDEKSNSYESKLSYHPEMMGTLGSMLVTWKDGDLYTHDDSTYNNFYGVQYPSSISFVWNESTPVKKVFNAIAYQSTQIWISDTNGDINTSMINPQTGLQQQSQLKNIDYEIQENVRYAAFLKDANSMASAQDALVMGDDLRGNWIQTNLICPADKATALVYLSEPYINWQPSGRNF